MKTVNEEFSAVLEVKKSKFISFLLPFSLYERRLNELKSLHPKARHFVVAYRYLNSSNQLVEYSTDDREPRGSAGKPTLKVLQGHELVNVALITIRYFGGILLGVGGLVRAYSDSANLVIQNSNLVDYKDIFEFEFSVDYDKTREIEYLIKKHSIFVEDRSFGINGIEYFIRDDLSKIKLIKESLQKR